MKSIKSDKGDQATSLRDLVEDTRLDSGDVRLSNKVFQLISEVRSEVSKKYSLSKPIGDMHWDEKVDQLPSEAWMMEQVLSMLERFMERQTGRTIKQGKRGLKAPGRHGGKHRGYES